MILIQRFTSLCLIFLLVACASTSNNNAQTQAKLDQLMVMSGMNAQLENIPLQIDTGLQQPSVLPAEFNQNLAKALYNSFTPALLKTSIRDYLALHLSTADTDAVLNWLQSPLGQKIAALESASSSIEAQLEIQQTLPELLADPKRFALIRSLDRASNTSGASIILILSVQEALMRGMMAGAPVSQRLTDEEIRAQINSMAPQIKAQYELLVVASMAYAYRSLSDDDIKTYIDFASSPSGMHFNQTLMEAIAMAMSKAGENAGKEMGKFLPTKTPKEAI